MRLLDVIPQLVAVDLLEGSLLVRPAFLAEAERTLFRLAYHWKRILHCSCREWLVFKLVLRGALRLAQMATFLSTTEGHSGLNCLHSSFMHLPSFEATARFTNQSHNHASLWNVVFKWLLTPATWLRVRGSFSVSKLSLNVVGVGISKMQLSSLFLQFISTGLTFLGVKQHRRWLSLPQAGRCLELS